jgi:hypothetical protein
VAAAGGGPGPLAALHRRPSLIQGGHVAAAGRGAPGGSLLARPAAPSLIPLPSFVPDQVSLLQGLRLAAAADTASVASL